MIFEEYISTNTNYDPEQVKKDLPQDILDYISAHSKPDTGDLTTFAINAINKFLETYGDENSKKTTIQVPEPENLSLESTETTFVEEFESDIKNETMVVENDIAIENSKSIKTPTPITILRKFLLEQVKYSAQTVALMEDNEVSKTIDEKFQAIETKEGKLALIEKGVPIYYL